MKIEVHDQTLVGKREDLAMSGLSVVLAVRCGRLRLNLYCIIEKRIGIPGTRNSGMKVRLLSFLLTLLK